MFDYLEMCMLYIVINKVFTMDVWFLLVSYKIAARNALSTWASAVATPALFKPSTSWELLPPTSLAALAEGDEMPTKYNAHNISTFPLRLT